jgi:glycosyltransferase involved in cell wall biosynthesis
VINFSLVIPCYNESRGIESLLERCRPICASPLNEVILVDNGSTDSTPEVLGQLLPKFPGCRSIRVDNNQGYGFGILSGLRDARGKVLAWTHADLQTDPLDALKALEIFSSSGPSLIKGRRFGRPAGDSFFTLGMSIFESCLLKKPMWDINAQPNLFSKSFFDSWKNDAPKDFSFDLFVYYMAKKMNLKIRRFPVHFGERQFGQSSWNTSWIEKKKFITRTIKFSLELKRRYT